MPGGSDGGSGTVTCTLHTAAQDSPFQPVPGLGPPPAELVEGEWYIVHCVDGDGNLVAFYAYQYFPGSPPVSPALLAVYAMRELPLVFPDPRTAPPMGTEALVGIETWLWIDEAIWAQRSATASALGVTATVTASPSHVVWHTGDGNTVVCGGPGTPWRRGLTDTDCGHTYQWRSRPTYTVLVEMVWEVTWVSNLGSSGSLGTVSRTTSFDITVGERQAQVAIGD